MTVKSWTRVCILCFTSYKILDNLIYSDRGKNPRGRRERARKDERKSLQKGTRNFGGVMNMFISLIRALVLQVYTYAKTYQTVYFKHLQFSLQLYLKKDV